MVEHWLIDFTKRIEQTDYVEAPVVKVDGRLLPDRRLHRSDAPVRGATELVAARAAEPLHLAQRHDRPCVQVARVKGRSGAGDERQEPRLPQRLVPQPAL